MGNNPKLTRCINIEILFAHKLCVLCINAYLWLSRGQSSLSLYNFTFSVSLFESVTSDLHFTCPSFKLAMGGININNGPVRGSAHVGSQGWRQETFSSLESNVSKLEACGLDWSSGVQKGVNVYKWLGLNGINTLIMMYFMGHPAVTVGLRRSSELVNTWTGAS